MLCSVFGPLAIHASRCIRLALQGVEEGSNYLHCSPESRKSDGKRTQYRGYNWATLFLGCKNNYGDLGSRLGESRIWDSKMWSWVLRDSDLRMNALARVSSNCKRQTHPLVEKVLCKDYDRRCSNKKILPWVLKARRQDELIGDKPPVETSSPSF
jgi:hypothetical protein